MGYGDGVMVVKKVRTAEGKVEIQEQLPSEQQEIFNFLLENNYINSLQEWAMDLTTFYDGYAGFRFAPNGKIVAIDPIESVNSRLSKANDEGLIEYHGYSLKWHENNTQDIKVTPLIDRRRPLMDLKEKRGIITGVKGKSKTVKSDSFVLQLMQPTPGRYYYGKPYWWAIFEAGWYDLAVAIPKFKKALIQNQMILKYHVKINVAFFDKLFASEGIDKNDAEKVKERKTKFYKEMNN